MRLAQSNALCFYVSFGFIKCHCKFKRYILLQSFLHYFLYHSCYIRENFAVDLSDDFWAHILTISHTRYTLNLFYIAGVFFGNSILPFWISFESFSFVLHSRYFKSKVWNTPAWSANRSITFIYSVNIIIFIFRQAFVCTNSGQS